jgi:GT2 family glycosyltransferase
MSVWGDIKLAVCLPIADPKLDRGFFLTFNAMHKPDNYEIFVPTISTGTFSSVRNEITENALNKGCTHIWMIDTDQLYPQDTLVKLIGHNLPIVCGKVHRRYPPFDPILYQKTKWKYKFRETPDEKWLDGQLVEVVATGAACMLVKAEVFKTVEQPWFKKLNPTKRRPFTVGEDIYFWTKVKEAGHRIFVDTSIEIGHISSLVINKNFYMLYKMARPNA